MSERQLFLHYERKQGGADLWAVKITPDNVHLVAKHVGGHVLEGPKGLVLPQNDKYIPVVVELWDYLVSHGDDLYSTFLGLTFEADYKRVEETPNKPRDEWSDGWLIIAKDSTQAECMAAKLGDAGIEPDLAMRWVKEVQEEAVQRERDRIKDFFENSSQYVRVEE